MRSETFGSVTLYQGDALEILPALAPAAFAGVLTDPPYCSGGTYLSDRSVATSAKYQTSDHRGLYPEFAGDTRDQRSFLAWSVLWMSRARTLVAEGGLIATFTDWRQLPVTSDAVQAAGWVWRGLVPWDKTERGRPQKGRYRAQAEYVVWGTNGARPMEGPTAPGVFRIPVPNVKHHIAGKPVGLMDGLLGPFGEGAILDPFMGSGTVGIACLRRGRPYVGIEMTQAYFDIACRRLEEAAKAPHLACEFDGD